MQFRRKHVRTMLPLALAALACAPPRACALRLGAITSWSKFTTTCLLQQQLTVLQLCRAD